MLTTETKRKTCGCEQPQARKTFNPKTLMCYQFENYSDYKKLTAEEKAIMDKLIAGNTNKEIARNLNMSEEKLEQKLTLIYAGFGLQGHHKKTGLFAKIIKYLQAGEDEYK